MDVCPSCGETLPMVDDAYCSFCRDPLHQHSKHTESVLAQYLEAPKTCPGCSTALRDCDVFEIRESRSAAIGRGFGTVVLAIICYLAFIFILRFFVGTLLFLVIFFTMMARGRNAPKMYEANCPECKWHERFRVLRKNAG